VASSSGLERDQQARDAVVDHLDDPARRRGHHRGLAGHRLEVHDAQRLVDRRAGEDVAWLRIWMTSGLGSIS
jgi:hypothetical protein